MVISIYTVAGGWLFQYIRYPEFGSFDIYGSRRLDFFNIYGSRR